MMFSIYARKSVCTDEGDSIESQINICKEYIDKHFIDVPDKQIYVYKDEGFSGKDTKRPQYTEMLKSIEKEKDGYIICYKLDRISRSISDFSSLIDKLSKKNISFISVKEHFDTSNPVGRGMMYICAVFAQMERESIAERVRDNMMFLAKTGRWLGGVAPFGFDIVRTSERIIVDGHSKKVSYLAPNEDIEIVKLIYSKYLELGSCIEVTRFLKNQGLQNRKNNKLSNPTVLDILRSPIYCTADKDAYEYFSKRTKNIFFKTSDLYKKLGIVPYNRKNIYRKFNPVSSWIIALGRHKGVISGKDWVKVQSMTHAPTSVLRSSKTPALFSTLIPCPKCGSTMRVRSANDGKYFYYSCSQKYEYGSKHCDCKSLNGIETDKQILQELFTIDIKDLRNKIHMKKNTHLYNKLDDKIFDTKYTISKLQNSKAQYINYLQKLNPQSPLIKDIEDKVSAINSQIKKMTSETYDLETKLRATKNEKTDLEEIVNAFEKLKNNFDTMDFKTKKSLARLIVKKLVWNDDKLVIIYNGI